MAKISIDEGELLMAFESGDGMVQWYLDRQTGDVIGLDDDLVIGDDYEEDDDAGGEDEDGGEGGKDGDDDEDSDDWQARGRALRRRIHADVSGERYLSIPSMSSNEGFRIMERFAASQEGRVREALLGALDRRHPFRSFKDALRGEVRERWFAYHEQRARRGARLAAERGDRRGADDAVSARLSVRAADEAALARTLPVSSALPSMAGGANGGGAMRYDNGCGRDYGGRYGGWQGPRYDEMFRGRERHAGPPQGRRGRDAGRMGWRDLGPGPHPGWHEHPAPGGTDFLGRPYPRESLDDRPWGLIEQDQRQARYAGPPRGYDRGYRGYGRGFRDAPRGAYGGRGRYDVGYDVRPEDYHARFIPDSDEAGMDVHRYGG